jgi:hypothetical protein
VPKIATRQARRKCRRPRSLSRRKPRKRHPTAESFTTGAPEIGTPQMRVFKLVEITNKPHRQRKAYRIEECRAALLNYSPWGGRIPTRDELPNRQYLKVARHVIWTDPKTKRLLRDSSDTRLNKTLKRIRELAR